MTKKVLVAYASGAGSTAEVADSVASVLSAHEGIVVDVSRAKEVKELDAYDIIVLGTAIRMGKPLGEMVTFVKNNISILKAKKVALFAVCMTVQDDTSENRKTAESFLAPLRQGISPVDEAVFAGKMDPEKLGVVYRMIMKMAKSPIGDFRDWDVIKQWARSLQQKL